jgi:chromosome segregation ATPase
MTIELEVRVKRLEDDMQAIKDTLNQVAELQRANQLQIDANSAAIGRLEERIDSFVTTTERLEGRIDSFVFEAQRLFANIGETSKRNEAAIETLSANVASMLRNAEEDRAESRATRLQIQSRLDRLEALTER